MTDLALFLATSGHSGVDRVMRNLISEFTRRGLRVDLLRIEGHGPHPESVPDNLRLVSLGTSHVNSSFPALVSYLRRERPTVLLADKDRLNRLALLARFFAGAPTRVAVRIGTTVSENLARRSWLDRNLQYFSFRRLYRWADAILVPSEGAARDLARVACLPQDRITVVPSPVVNDRLFSLAAEASDHPWLAPGEPPVILGVGELCARKDFATLVRAFARLRRTTPARLVILGEGRQRELLEGMVRDLGLTEDVALPGFIRNPYVWMGRSAVFVLSSRCEGAPVVLMEAMAVGTPVVSTDCPSGPREILSGGRFGRLVPIGDDEALAVAIQATLETSPSEDISQAVAPFAINVSADRYLAALGLSTAGKDIS